MRDDSKCDKGFWSWTKYDKKCLHKECKKYRLTNPMPEKWKGPKEKIYQVINKYGRIYTVHNISTGVAQPSGEYSISKQEYERIKKDFIQ